MSQIDQAAGLRRWAQAGLGSQAEPKDAAPTPTPESRAAASRVLMIVGLAGDENASLQPVHDALQRWCEQGQRWVGEPEQWRLVPIAVDSPHLATLLGQQGHWALWVGDDGDGFRRAYRTLKRLAQRGGPKRLLLVHPPFASRAGLLSNLQQAAAEFLGLELWIVPLPRRPRLPSEASR
ncbi:MAG: hypothetical protein U9Q35_14705 [Pseudomonadota bacterium]|uniref:hypothetical protein n=1 Tax=Halomonas sp. IOP_31 TaxID=2876584 RepID=UPI001E3B5BB8|nr:hypothetical protein [Halomonas sp. IOP_31]MCD6008397.1 hypothetical protein [Halomonas sp. IOP_31]MEA3252768.1 hypothetical protein [Pseudomonadota bacterium]